MAGDWVAVRLQPCMSAKGPCRGDLTAIGGFTVGHCRLRMSAVMAAKTTMTADGHSHNKCQFARIQNILTAKTALVYYLDKRPDLTPSLVCGVSIVA